MDDKIKRINELYHKSKSVGLSEDEKAEQARLRKEYVECIRGNLRSQLDSMTIQYEDGTRERVSDRRKRVEASEELSVLEQKKALRISVKSSKESGIPMQMKKLSSPCVLRNEIFGNVSKRIRYFGIIKSGWSREVSF